MSRRRPQRTSRPGRSPERVEQVEQWPDGAWAVRPVTGSAATKAYRCPGCDQLIRPATPHVVAWPADDGGSGGVAERRHWHTGCWQARGRRRSR
ncbi:MAG: hypothetical protein ACODAF_03420 [Actinomycetota bacterium]